MGEETLEIINQNVNCKLHWEIGLLVILISYIYYIFNNLKTNKVSYKVFSPINEFWKEKMTQKHIKKEDRTLRGHRNDMGMKVKMQLH